MGEQKCKNITTVHKKVKYYILLTSISLTATANIEKGIKYIIT